MLDSSRNESARDVCLLHIEPFFLPVVLVVGRVEKSLPTVNPDPRYGYIRVIRLKQEGAGARSAKIMNGREDGTKNEKKTM